MPRRKKKKKLFYLGVKSSGKHAAPEINENKEKKETENIEKKRIAELKKQNKIEDNQKKREEKERIKRIENKNKQIRKSQKKEKREELKQNKYTNRKNDDEIFDFDKEIVLGINGNIVKKAEKNKAKLKSNNFKKRTKKKNKKMSFLVKCTMLITIGVSTVIFTLTSSVFNITEIIVEGNKGVKTETIIGLAGVQVGENLFKINTNNMISNIKNNTYIKKVEISKNIPSTLKITISERNATYMLECAGNYIYMDNQGYLLELTQIALDVPVLTGFEASEDELLKIKRLEVKDLTKLSDVLKITETTNGYELYENITKIDVSNSKNYIIHMDKIGKIVYIGETSDLNNKILHLKEILKDTEGQTGSIYLNGNLNDGFKPYFRESI